MMTTQRFLCCLKYGTVFPSDYVNVLYHAARAAIRGPFRFLCLTDHAEGLVPGIEALPIPDVGLLQKEWFVGGVWPKLGIYDRHFHGLKGRLVFIDLDMVILRDLDAFFDLPGSYIGIDGGDNWGKRGRKAKQELCSALIAYDIGSQGQIVEAFRSDKARIMATYQTEQAFTEAVLDKIDYWPEGWVISFKRALRRPIPLDLFLEPKQPPQTAKVLAFHGKPRPMDLIAPRSFFWDRFPHMGHGPVSWMVDYWREHGGGNLSSR